ncbi:MAG: ATP-binding protein [Chitinophagaceae bacterium]
MEPSKKLEAEVMQVYDTWLNSYISGDVQVYDSFLDDDYKFIGSTDNEEFLSRNDTTRFFEATADQLAGKTDIRNSTKTIRQFGDLIFITHLFDAWFLNGTEWSYYGRFRFTSALKKNKEGWRFIYQHFSTPDSKAQEGETIGYEQVTAENIQLRDAIKRRTIELEQKNRELEKALENLKSTQAQLIQSEKMASLGELTAGIAHEIQNPLNFVNNFSEVSNELIDEMNGELDKGDINEAKVIAADVKQNLEKINHHGKRADAIVKGMLQHSRASSGKKEPTDINALADEYLRLSYHGLRAKDKSFNADFKSDFDESIGKINIIPQDIGRVILNLLTNAFFAVSEKKKQQTEGYEPTVSVNTKKINDKIEIRVKDNGNGIPQKVIDKIFQPFFTTKPTGQGTGLGLSLSYDIIKAHGGEIKVETKVDEGNPDNFGKGEGTEFIIQLPA